MHVVELWEYTVFAVFNSAQFANLEVNEKRVDRNRTIMKLFMTIAAGALLGLSPMLYAGESSGVTVSHYEPLQRIGIARETSYGQQKDGASQPVMLSFDALGTEFNLQLEPNEGLISAATRSSLGERLGIYRGRLAGNPDSWVRIVLAEGVPAGLIWDGEQMYAIERPGDSTLAITEPIIYRLADAFVAPGAMSCGASIGNGSAAAMYRELAAELGSARVAGPGATEELTLGAAGDFEFFQRIGATAEDAIITRFNNVDGIYSEQLGIQIRLAELEVFTDAADPFSDTTVPGLLLGDVSSYRTANPAQVSQGLTHLYTGRDLDTSTVGIAYSGALCSSIFGAGLSEGRRGATTDSLIAAHEIGHNFGAPHDGEAGSPCASEMGDFLMSPTVSSSDQFSSCSILQMADDIAAATCIQPLPSVDVIIGLSGAPPEFLLGQPRDVTFDVSNIGTSTATNVIADVTLPANLTLDAVVPSAGSCSTGTGTVSCLLGDIPGSSARNVIITTTPNTVGPGTINASVSADVDDNMGNNTDAVAIVVDPAVDLAVRNASSTSVAVNANITIGATIDNLSMTDATGVTLAATLDDGLRPNSASWSLGSCTVADQRVDCSGSDLAGQSDTALSIDVTGVTTGTKNFVVTVSSAEADTMTSNNTGGGSVSVFTPGGGGGAKKSKGGGAPAPLFLWILASVALCRCGRKSARQKTGTGRVLMQKID